MRGRGRISLSWLACRARFAEAESIVKADLPPEEAASNAAYLKKMLSRRDNPRAGAATMPVASLNRPD
jgi:Flp pilus assembly protein TadD